jgi:hypothetical protein
MVQTLPYPAIEYRLDEIARYLERLLDTRAAFPAR